MSNILLVRRLTPAIVPIYSLNDIQQFLMWFEHKVCSFFPCEKSRKSYWLFRRIPITQMTSSNTISSPSITGFTANSQSKASSWNLSRPPLSCVLASRNTHWKSLTFWERQILVRQTVLSYPSYLVDPRVNIHWYINSCATQFALNRFSSQKMITRISHVK